MPRFLINKMHFKIITLVIKLKHSEGFKTTTNLMSRRHTNSNAMQSETLHQECENLIIQNVANVHMIKYECRVDSAYVEVALGGHLFLLELLFDDLNLMLHPEPVYAEPLLVLLLHLLDLLDVDWQCTILELLDLALQLCQLVLIHPSCKKFTTLKIFKVRIISIDINI